MPTITVHNDGFEIGRELGRPTFLRWADIREVFAFKLDLLTSDNIRLGFRIDSSAEYSEVDEDWPGFQELITELERRFELVADWWQSLVWPPFAENRITLWGEPSAQA